MRTAIACSLAVLVACGGAAQKPAASEADTSSLESGSGGSAATESTPAAAATAAPSPTPAPTDAPAAQDSAAAPTPTHPVPAATGSIDGKPFAPKFAQLAGPVQKDGRVLIMIHEGSDCATATDASMSLIVPWKDGYKTDLSSLKRAKGASLNEAAFVRQADGKKKQVSSTFKPTGLVTIVSAPTQKDAIGKMKIDLQSGDYMLAGDLDVKVCVAPK
jgi:hypothetical protein